jgi:hypothetical protein
MDKFNEQFNKYVGLISEGGYFSIDNKIYDMLFAMKESVYSIYGTHFETIAANDKYAVLTVSGFRIVTSIKQLKKLYDLAVKEAGNEEDIAIPAYAMLERDVQKYGVKTPGKFYLIAFE